MKSGGLALLDTLVERLAQVKPETRSDKVTNVKAQAIVDILAHTLAAVKGETLSEKLADAKAGKLDEIRH